MVMVVVAVCLHWTVASPAQAGEEPTPAALLLVPGLVWRDAPPSLGSFAKASLSVRAAPADSTALDGYLTIGKGARSGAPESGFGEIFEAGTEWRVADWARLRRHDRELHYRGEIGSLGGALARAGRKWTLVTDDQAAALAAADTGGVVPRAVAGGAGSVEQALATGSDVIAAVPPAGLAAVLTSALEVTGEPGCVIVASVSTAGMEHLGVLAASPGCGFGTGGLTSPSTHQPGLVSLVDVAPSFLAATGIAVPDSMTGAPVERSEAVSVERLVDADRRASTADRVRTPLVWLFVLLHAIVALTVLAAHRLRRWAVSRLGRSAVLAVLAVPVSSFLLMVFPWWRSGFSGAVITGGVIAAALAVAASLTTRDDPTAGVLLLLAVTGAVVGIDALFRGALEVDAPFGNSPIRGGRYFGVGNIGFAFLASSLIMGSALALERWGSRAWPWVVGTLAAGVVAVGAPWFGADAGGVLALVPAIGVLLLTWRGRRLSLRQAAVVVAVAGLAVLSFAVVDSMRLQSSRTHLGRALSGDDERGDVVARKGSRALATLKTPIANIIWIGSLTLLVVPPRTGRRPALRAGAWSVVTLAVLGSVLNDSGLQVGAAVAAISWPVFASFSLHPPEPETAPFPAPVVT